MVTRRAPAATSAAAVRHIAIEKIARVVLTTCPTCVFVVRAPAVVAVQLAMPVLVRVIVSDRCGGSHRADNRRHKVGESLSEMPYLAW